MNVQARSEKLRELEYMIEKKQEELNKKQEEVQRLTRAQEQLRQQIDGERATATENEQHIEDAIQAKKEELQQVLDELAVWHLFSVALLI